MTVSPPAAKPRANPKRARATPGPHQPVQILTNGGRLVTCVAEFIAMVGLGQQGQTETKLALRFANANTMRRTLLASKQPKHSGRHLLPLAFPRVSRLVSRP